ncbi:MAG: hypothetical protein ABW110_14755, partial [Steroidobacteraceae bacterium]
MHYVIRVIVGALSATLAVGACFAANACGSTQKVTEATPDQVRSFFKSKQREVVTFVGYSGAGYDDASAMLRRADSELTKLNPKRTVINSGA